MKRLILALLLPLAALAQQTPQAGAIFSYPVAGSGGGGSGPYGPSSFTNNAVLIGGGTGNIQATSILSSNGGNALTALNSITSATGQDITVAALDGNHNVNLVPSGTGAIQVFNTGFVNNLATTGPNLAVISTGTGIAGPNLYFQGGGGVDAAFRNGGTNGIIFDIGGASTAANNSFSIRTAASNSSYSVGTRLVVKGGGNVIIGSSTDNSNGLLQINSTSSATGIGLNSDVSLYRATANTLNIVASAGVILSGNISTAAGATAAAQPWNLGGVRTSTALTPSTTTGIQVSINGTLYTLAVLSSNP